VKLPALGVFENRKNCRPDPNICGLETSTRNGGFSDSFGYDSAGNPTTFKGVTKTYNSKNQQTATGFVYDGNGNPTTYGGTIRPQLGVSVRSFS
jgi:hypothetical protein